VLDHRRIKHRESAILGVVAVVVIAVGVAGFVYGEQDDSPGAQLLGAMLVVGTLAFVVRTVRSTRS